eukprot:3931261-Rhodomonas_salina.2
MRRVASSTITMKATMLFLLCWTASNLGLVAVATGEVLHLALGHVQDRHILVDAAQQYDILDVDVSKELMDFEHLIHCGELPFVAHAAKRDTRSTVLCCEAGVRHVVRASEQGVLCDAIVDELSMRR